MAEDRIFFACSGLGRDAARPMVALATLAWTLCSAPLAWAQSAPAAQRTVTSPATTNESQLEDIVVTAQKREQRISDVPMTINATKGEVLQALGVTDVSSLPRVAPGVTVSNSYYGYPIISIRGINFAPAQIAASPAATAYIDEAPLPYPPSWGGLLLDVDHIEVLKGPQGTLFGENATGGALNVVAAKPTSHLSFGGQLDVDQYGRVTSQAYISGPLSDTLAARLSLLGDVGGAWQRGYVPGYTGYDQSISGYDNFEGRVLLDWKPMEDLKFELNVNGTRNTSKPEAWQLNAYIPVVPAGADAAFYNWPKATNARQAQTDYDPDLNDYTFQSALRGEWDFSPEAQLISVTNYVSTQSAYASEYSATAIPGITSEAIGTARTVSQELRVAGQSPDELLHYTAGGYYELDDLHDLRPNQEFSNYSAFNAYDLAGAALKFDYPATAESYAFFANTDWLLLPGLTLTGGARYTWARQTISGCTFANNLNASLGTTGTPNYVGKCITLDDVPGSAGNGGYISPDNEESQSANNVSWRTGLSYKLDNDTLLFGTASRGYKNGTFNGPLLLLSGTVPGVKPEELTSYEVGIKTKIFQFLELDTSGFHYDYVNKQIYTYAPSILGPNQVLENIPKSKVDGFDADATAHLNDLTLNGAVTLARSRIGNFQTYDIDADRINATGQPFNFAPKWSATFGATYQPEITHDLRGVIGVDGQYQGSTTSALTPTPSLAIPSYTVFNARLGVESSKGWRAQLWVHNLTDKYYWTATSAPADFSIKLPGLPRIFGITFGYTF
jgi:iron complex outermembrane recepter protein